MKDQIIFHSGTPPPALIFSRMAMPFCENTTSDVHSVKYIFILHTKQSNTFCIYTYIYTLQPRYNTLQYNANLSITLIGLAPTKKLCIFRRL
jgi:hypothetical protein